MIRPLRPEEYEPNGKPKKKKPKPPGPVCPCCQLPTEDLCDHLLNRVPCRVFCTQRRFLRKALGVQYVQGTLSVERFMGSWELVAIGRTGHVVSFGGGVKSELEELLAVILEKERDG